MADGNPIRMARRLSGRTGPIITRRLIAPALALALSGCSLIGLGVGAGVDALRSKAPIHMTSERAAELRAGSLLTLVMIDSSTTTGVLLAPQPSGGEDSLETGLRLAHLRSEHPAVLDTLLVPLERIAYARSPRPRHAARTGFRFGLNVDLVLLGLASVVTLTGLLILLALSASGFSFG